MKNLIRLAVAGIVCLGLISCVSTEYKGKSFPETHDLLILKSSSDKSDYELVGTGQASGEYSGTSNSELRNRLYELGLEHGANAMRIAGVRLIPEGHVVNMAEYNFIEATNEPDQTQFGTQMQEDISGDPNHGCTRYVRVMYAEYYRKKLDKKL